MPADRPKQPTPPQATAGAPAHSDFGPSYRNSQCQLARRGITPYRRCRYCTLKTRSCLGMQNNLITLLVGLLLLAFLILNDSLLIRTNIVLILGLLFVLGYKINNSLDSLSRSDFRNLKLNHKLKNHAQYLEHQVRSRTRKLEAMLIKDTLTDLINRREFEKRLQNDIQDAHQKDSHHVLCFLDLDQFKIINDTCGHVAGDELLRQITPILLGHVRDKDTVARLGGDEFGILFNNCQIEQAVNIADRIRQSVEDYRFAWHEHSFAVGVSIGMIGINRDSGTMVDLLAAVDDACYRAKELGRNRIHVYEYDAVDIDRRHGEMQWASRIPEALDADRFLLFYQPIIPLQGSDQKERHFEVLVRMLDENGELVPPMAFLPAAERFNLMPRIDRWVISTALRSHAALSEVRPTRLSINLSGTSFSDENLLSYIKDRLTANNIPPAMVCFEITETATISNLSRASEFIAELRKIGCSFSLDDFGSGLSSFGYLKNLPVDYLKIDGGFVKDMLHDKADYAMVEVINYIGHALHKKTVAEFVENASIQAALTKLGVDYAQGYGIERPLPLESLIRHPDHKAELRVIK